MFFSFPCKAKLIICKWSSTSVRNIKLKSQVYFSNYGYFLPFSFANVKIGHWFLINILKRFWARHYKDMLSDHSFTKAIGVQLNHESEPGEWKRCDPTSCDPVSFRV